MTTHGKITREVLENYLQCKTKGFLTLTGERETKTGYEAWRLRVAAQQKVGAAAKVDSDAKCNPVDSIGSSTKSRVSHSERRPSARFPGDEDGSARRNIEPLQ